MDPHAVVLELGMAIRPIAVILPPMAGKCAVFFTGDSNFNPYACFSAASVCAHSGNSLFDVYLCSDGLTDNERDFMESLSIRPILIDSSELSIQGTPACHNLPPACYYRLYFDRFLPEGYDRVIYLDGDTFLDGSLRPLADLDLEGRAIAAVRGLGTAGCRSEEEKRRLVDYWNGIGITANRTFNSGVMVIDVERWREDELGRRTMTRVNEQLNIDDEEALNIVLQDDWLELSPRWNFPSSQLRLDVESEIQPTIHHYMHSPKPWHRSWMHHPSHRKRYKSFFAQSPWPKAAESWPKGSNPGRHLRKKIKQLTRSLLTPRKGSAYRDDGKLGRWLRDAVVTSYNEGVTENRFADHRQGLTKLSLIK